MILLQHVFFCLCGQVLLEESAIACAPMAEAAAIFEVWANNFRRDILESESVIVSPPRNTFYWITIFKHYSYFIILNARKSKCIDEGAY